MKTLEETRRQVNELMIILERPEMEARQQLLDEGYDPVVFGPMVHEVLETRSSNSGKGTRKIIWGLVLIVVGLALSMTTTRIFYGAVLVGLGSLIRGLINNDD